MEEVETTWREVQAGFDIYVAADAPIIRIPDPEPQPQTTALAKTGGAVAGVLGGLVGGVLGMAGRLLGGRSGDSYRTTNSTRNETNYIVRDSFNTTTSIQNTITLNFNGMYGAQNMLGDDEASAEEIAALIVATLPDLTPEQRTALLQLPTRELFMVLAFLRKAGAAGKPVGARLGVGLVENVLGLPRGVAARRQPLLSRVGDEFLTQVFGA